MSLSNLLPSERQCRSANSVTNLKKKSLNREGLSNCEMTVFEISNAFVSVLDAESTERPRSDTDLFRFTLNTLNPRVFSHVPFLEQSRDSNSLVSSEQEEPYKERSAKSSSLQFSSKFFPNLKRRSRLQLMRNFIGSCCFWINTAQTINTAEKELSNLFGLRVRPRGCKNSKDKTREQ